MRIGHARVPTDDVRSYAAIAAANASRGQLLGEGIDIVVDVPGEADGASPSDAAERYASAIETQVTSVSRRCCCTSSTRPR